MNIKIKRNERRDFNELEIGTIFEKENEIYIKIDPIRTVLLCLNAVHLKTGNTFYFSFRDEYVTVLKNVKLEGEI